jgi:hypothetical protein
MNMTALRDTVQCSLLETDRRFRRVFYLHHHVGLPQQDYTVLYLRRLSSSLLGVYENKVLTRTCEHNTINIRMVKSA